MIQGSTEVATFLYLHMVCMGTKDVQFKAIQSEYDCKFVLYTNEVFCCPALFLHEAYIREGAIVTLAFHITRTLFFWEEIPLLMHLVIYMYNDTCCYRKCVIL